MHVVYLIFINLYIILAYINEFNPKLGVDEVEKKLLIIGLALGIIYPAIYDGIQLYLSGICDYINDPWNYIDFLYIYGSISNCFLQWFYGPDHLASKIVMIIIVFMALIKTFFFLRIFESFTPLVVMLTKVVSDLKIFLFFYAILLIFFGNAYAVLGVSNYNRPGGFKEKYGKELKQGISKDTDSEILENFLEIPGSEYLNVGLYFGEIMYTFRASIGDNAIIDSSPYLDRYENWTFWFMWFLTVFITCIVFLNFIIAEASASYSRVMESLVAVI